MDKMWVIQTAKEKKIPTELSPMVWNNNYSKETFLCLYISMLEIL